MGRILYLCPAVAEPRGGIRTIYHHVEALVGAGLQAAVVHFEPGFRPTWFASTAPVLDASGNFALNDTDTLVFPEDFGAALVALRGVALPKVVFCQNHYHVFETLEHDAHYRDFGVQRILASTNIIAGFCERVFGLPTDVVPYALDLQRLTPTPAQRQRQIAYMPRKGPWNLRIARGILHHERPDLAHVPWVPIEGKSEAETATLLQASDVYLSTSLREGFGLPPLEAMACGAVVVGFAGGGGNEYARPDNGVWVPDEDPMALAAALARTLDQLATAPSALEALRANAVAMARTFTLERQKHELLRYWGGFA